MQRFTTFVAPLVLAGITEGVQGPCDILVAAGNPCVAAHSTTRALYAAYDGPLYNVTRSSDGMSANVTVLEAGGFANITMHDEFCTQLDCVISNVYDQSPQANHLHQRHKLVNASQHKVIVGNNVFVYGMWFDPGYGYHQEHNRNRTAQ
jgi:non-reducing end alpha-L-arabinofuranosidase